LQYNRQITLSIFSIFVNPMMIPQLDKPFTQEQLSFLEIFSKSCRRSILEMTTNAASGHPGGSLSCVDYLTLLYTFIISQTGDPVVVSNGHISPAVYAVLGEMKYISKKGVVEGFRKIGEPYEGHVTRHVPGVWYGTGPLGAGVSAASGFALAQKFVEQQRTPLQLPPKKGEGNSALPKKVFALVGDGESEEGQVYEMMNFAKKYELDNFIVFMDYNEVQLTDSIKKIMPYDPKAYFQAAGWHVIDVDGHDYNSMWSGLGEAYGEIGKPVLLLGHTIMGKGVDFMEKTGQAYEATWHGKAGSREQIDEVLNSTLALTEDQKLEIRNFVETNVKWKPGEVMLSKQGSFVDVAVGEARVYAADEVTDCRSAYGNALRDLAAENDNVVALTADVAGSVKTNILGKEFPDRHIECGIAEQQMVSCAGGMSLSGMIPFCSTFGAFMTSRAKDQARVNDLNQCNVKMVATHCGLSVGEDGPTHQAIDDSGSVLGFFNTMQIEPADPNQCDRMVRYIASHYGNVYMRMGRHKIPVLTKENGEVFFDKDYEYTYGRCDVLREGTDFTIAAMGPTVHEAFAAWEMLKEKGVSAEVVMVSSIKKFNAQLFESIKKTGRVLTVEDHNMHSGLASQLLHALREKNIVPKVYESLGVKEYQLSGTWRDLYKAAGIDRVAIEKTIEKVI
jgi:transketolase